MLSAGNCVLRWCITWHRKLPIKSNWTVSTLLLSCPAHVCKYLYKYILWKISLRIQKTSHCCEEEDDNLKKKKMTISRRRRQSQEEKDNNLTSTVSTDWPDTCPACAGPYWESRKAALPDRTEEVLHVTYACHPRSEHSGWTQCCGIFQRLTSHLAQSSLCSHSPCKVKKNWSSFNSQS